MATLFLDARERIVGAKLTEEEIALIEPMLATPEAQLNLEVLFQTLITQWSQELVNREKQVLSTFIDTATASQRSALLATIATL